MANSATDKVDLLMASPRSDYEKAPEYNPAEGDRAIISTVNRYYQEKAQNKRAFEKTWFVSHAAIVGQHYLIWNDLNRSFEIPMRVPPHRVRLVVNYMMPYFRRTKARLTAHRPGLHLAPATNDEADQECAEIGLQVLESELDRLRFQELFKRSVGWLIETGNVVLAVRWDPWAGPELYEDRQSVDLMTGMATTERGEMRDEFQRPLHRGEVVMDVVSPYEFEIDARATSMMDANWCMRNTIRHVEWVRSMYPEMGKYVKPEEVYLHSFYLKRHKQLVGIYGYTSEAGGEADRQQAKDSVVVHEYWERPTPRYPRGRMIVVANSVLLHNREHPYPELLELGYWAPYVHIREIDIPGRFWGMATIEQAFPLNKALNRSRSMEEENRALHGRPKILVPRTSKIRQGSFDAEAGEKVDYSPGPRGERPEMLSPPSTAHATQLSIQHAISDMQEVMAWHEVSRGILPSANIPGVAVDKLQQADETALGETEAHIRDGIIDAGRMVLALANKFWTEERLIRVTGEDSAITARRVRGDQLAGKSSGANYYDVRMTPQSTMWRDPQQQRKMVGELQQMQLLDPVQHRRLTLKMLDLASIQEIYKDDKLDESYARHENDLMEQGQYGQPRDFENHAIHMQEHNRFRKSERYRRLPPEQQQGVDQHVAIHEQWMIAVTQKQAQAQVAVQNVLDQPEPEEEAVPEEASVPEGEAPPETIEAQEPEPEASQPEAE